MEPQTICQIISIVIAAAVILEAILMFLYKKKHKKFAYDDNRNASQLSDKQKNMTYEQLRQNNPLPENADYSEVENFLIKTRFAHITGENFWFCSEWETSSFIINANLSENAIQILRCLDSDLTDVFEKHILLSEDSEGFRDNYTAI